jgi:putative membrane protein insertion efficiency factor
MRPPKDQISVKAFEALVAFYRADIHPFTDHFFRCRYRPTCSQYSLEAIKKYGILKGGDLAIRRIWSCRRSVPMGTYDPVP